MEAKRRMRRAGRHGMVDAVRTKRHPLNFEKYAAEGNHFVNDVANELGCERNTAARITRAVLHAVRDRLNANDAVEFAQGLPMMLKAVYFEQYDVSSMPVLLRHPHDFLDYVFYMDEFSADVDFPRKSSVEDAIVAVFNVLENYMDPGQINQIKKMLGKQIVEMIEGKRSFFHATSKLYIPKRKPSISFERTPSRKIHRKLRAIRKHKPENVFPL